MTDSWVEVAGELVKGHRVASGLANDPRFPQGTLALQAPLFLEKGLNLSDFYPGTLNVSISPKKYRVLKARFHFEGLKWSPNDPAENFLFLDCRVGVSPGVLQTGMIYYPDPATKPGHFQPADVLEILAPEIPDIEYGDSLLIQVNPEQIHILLS